MGQKIYPEHIKRILNLYIVEDKNAAEIAKELEVSATTILRILRNENVTILPKRRPWSKGKKLLNHSWNRGLTAKSHPSIAAGVLTRQKLFEKGELKTRGEIPPEIEKIRREKIRKSINERYAKGWEPKAGRCKKIKHISPIAGEVLVDGTWEHLLALHFDNTGIKWVRNKNRFVYKNEQCKESYYTPDFFLPENDIYIEVKGYETEKDRCKWRDFPHKMKVIRKEHIQQIKNDTFNLLEFLMEK